MPVAHIGTEKSKDLKQRLSAMASESLTKEFRAYGFRIADPLVVAGAIADAKLDIQDDEQYRKDSFYTIGEKANADIVVFASIQQNSLRQSSGRRQGFATIKFWLLDVKRRQAIINAVTREEPSGGSWADGIKSGVSQQEKAVRTASLHT
jgi:hypothetical protein